MRSDSLDAILSSIDEKTVGSVLKERKKRMKTAPETEVRKTPEGAPEEYTVIEESKSKNRWKGVLKAVSVTAAVAMIAVFAYLCYLPIYMQEHGLTPGRQPGDTEATSSEIDTLTGEKIIRIDGYLKDFALQSEYDARNMSRIDEKTTVTGELQESFPDTIPIYEIEQRNISDDEMNIIVSLVDPKRFPKNQRFQELKGNRLNVAGETTSPELIKLGSFDISDQELEEKAWEVLKSIPFIADDYKCAGISSTRTTKAGDETYITRIAVVFRRYFDGLPVSGDDKITIEFTKLGLEGISMNLYNYKKIDTVSLISLDEAYKKINAPDGFTISQNSGKQFNRCETLEVISVRLTLFNQNRSGARILVPIYDFKGIATDGNGVQEEFTSSVIAMTDGTK